ncbi:hypothetical protein GF386_02125 [Candidatus Pacearchaeota archaeon]|nr:hypothetical protein [Candidatus Pacearchaeota archaeon]MBD3282965.1 hypothetical protein [Candidatus Pacearchaeota archaeon]
MFKYLIKNCYFFKLLFSGIISKNICIKINISIISGNWDIGINICSKDFKDFDNTMYEIRTRFSKIIKEFQVGSVVDEYKSDYMVDLIEI